MPIEILQPVAVGAYDQWNLAAGPTKWEAVRLPDDEGTTRIVESVQNQRQSFRLSDLPRAASIVSVTAHMRADETAPNATINMFTRLGGVDLDYSAHTLTTSWADFENVGISKPGGGGWLPNDFPPASQLELGVRLTTISAGESGRVTTLTMPVEYVAVAGGFRWLLQAWLPPLLAVASHGLVRRELVTFFRGFRLRPSNDEDFARILEAIRVRPIFG